MIPFDALPEAVLAAMRAHAAFDYPLEACGVVVQTAAGCVAVPCRHVDPAPTHGFYIDPRDVLALAEREAAGEPLVAIYHSHCDSPATFSPRDRAYAATRPDVLHLVLCVTARGVVALRAYDAAGAAIEAAVPA